MRTGVALAVAAAIAATGCMRFGAPPAVNTRVAAQPDSATIALWHMDERAGSRVIDAGPHRLEGTAGRATLTPFGRMGLARSFRRSLDSFVFVPYDPALETAEALTIDCWLYPTAWTTEEDSPIAARWTEDGQQSWMFSLGGRGLLAPVNVDPSPGYHAELFRPPAAGRLWFVYQPAAAGTPRAFVSVRTIELERWTHVAVTFDGEEVRFYVDGLLDAQFASTGRIRPSTAPLLIGNYLDPRTLTRFGGYLRPEITGSTTAHYAYQGTIDELHLSSEARRSFGPR
jgi:hypothetical protein